MRDLTPLVFLIVLLARADCTFAVSASTLQTDDTSVLEASQALLTFLTFSTIPDPTLDSLQIDSRTGDDPNVLLSQLGGGFTLSGSLPFYLEGYLGYARYDPDFVVSGVEQTGLIKATWRTYSATGGIGYDFKLADEWVIRPIANFSLSHMTSNAALVGTLMESSLTATGLDAREWLDSGWLSVGGIGASLILDFERKQLDYEADLELRYTHYYLTSLDSSEGTVDGNTHTDTLGLWGRLRIPSGYSAFDRPVRVVFDGAHSWFTANQTEILGFDQLSKVGVGLELDLGAKDILVERIRLVGRYVFGENIAGWSLGFGLSF
jgi:hypothetical protein